MKFVAYNFWQSALKRRIEFFLVFFLFSGCSSLEKEAQTASTEEPVTNTTATQNESFTKPNPKKVKLNISTDMEWGIQFYEAGDYQRSLEYLIRAEKDGAEKNNFNLIPYYKGMDLFRLEKFEESEKYLRSFLQSNASITLKQSCQITLLKMMERQERWGDLSALALETTKVNLMQENRILVKLLWARALSKSKEVQGAKRIFDEAETEMANFPEPQSLVHNLDNDLNGRLHATKISMISDRCERLEPKRVSKTKVMYQNWIQAFAFCWREGEKEFSANLLSTGSPWANVVHPILGGLLEKLDVNVKSYLNAEKNNIQAHLQLKNVFRESLYSLIEEIDKAVKTFKNQQFEQDKLFEFRKQIDHLLVSISSTS